MQSSKQQPQVQALQSHAPMGFISGGAHSGKSGAKKLEIACES
jgi:hypothetical protein